LAAIGRRVAAHVSNRDLRLPRLHVDRLPE
jgi:hypothetical protein